MAFKMTPGIKGNPAQSRIAGLGACGGPGQPPCEPRFEKEVKEEKRMRAADRSISSKNIRPKAKTKPIQDAPAAPPIRLKLNEGLLKGFEMSREVETRFKMMFGDLSGFKSQEDLDTAVMKFVRKNSGPKPNPGELEISVPRGEWFKSREEEMMFYTFFEKAIKRGDFKSQEQLDKAIAMRLETGSNHGSVKPPGDIFDLDPSKPVLIPIKGKPFGGEYAEAPKYESELNDKLKAASIEQAKARFVPIESSTASKVKPKA